MSLFEDFKLSPACAQVRYAQGDITRTPLSILTSSHSPNMQQNHSCTPAESFKRVSKEIQPSATHLKMENSGTPSAGI